MSLSENFPGCGVFKLPEKLREMGAVINVEVCCVEHVAL